MSDLVIKGTSVGHSYEDWKNDPRLLSSMLLSIMQTWLSNNYEGAELQIECSEVLSREYGKIRNAYFAITNDIHNLSVLYHMLRSIENDEDMDFGVAMLYTSTLVENYFVNLRSIYDFTVYFPRILLSENNLNQLPSRKEGSLKEFAKFCKKNGSERLFSPELLELIISIESDLDDIRTIRDAIIHRGKEPMIFMGDKQKNRKTEICVPKGFPSEVNLLPDILNCKSERYPLFEYIKVLTTRVIHYMEHLGQIIYSDLIKQDKDNQKIWLTALSGICMTSFVEFIFEIGDTAEKTS